MQGKDIQGNKQFANLVWSSHKRASAIEKSPVQEEERSLWALSLCLSSFHKTAEQTSLWVVLTFTDHLQHAFLHTALRSCLDANHPSFTVQVNHYHSTEFWRQRLLSNTLRRSVQPLRQDWRQPWSDMSIALSYWAICPYRQPTVILFVSAAKRGDRPLCSKAQSRWKASNLQRHPSQS